PPLKPQRLAVLETSGWAIASDPAKTSLQESLQRLRAAGVDIRTRHDDEDVAAAETELADAFALSNLINTFEMRWFIAGCAGRGAGKPWRVMLEPHEGDKTRTAAAPRPRPKQRAGTGAVYAELAESCAPGVPRAAPGAPPAGLQATGNPQFAVPASLL